MLARGKYLRTGGLLQIAELAPSGVRSELNGHLFSVRVFTLICQSLCHEAKILVQRSTWWPKASWKSMGTFAPVFIVPDDPTWTVSCWPGFFDLDLQDHQLNTQQVRDSADLFCFSGVHFKAYYSDARSNPDAEGYRPLNLDHKRG